MTDERAREFLAGLDDYVENGPPLPSAEQPDEVIPPPPPQIVKADAKGHALAADDNIVPAVTIDLELTDGTTVRALTTDEGVGMILDLLREAQRDARRRARVAESRKANR